VDNPAIQALAARVEVLEDEGYSARYPAEQVCDLRIVLASGQVHLGRCTVTKGEPSKPHQPAELEAKFMRLGAPTWGEAVTRRLLDGCMKIEDVPDFSRFSEGFDL
jgi:2-methylcitrate dehydratase PrpD